VIQFKHSGERK